MTAPATACATHRRASAAASTATGGTIAGTVSPGGAAAASDLCRPREWPPRPAAWCERKRAPARPPPLQPQRGPLSARGCWVAYAACLSGKPSDPSASRACPALAARAARAGNCPFGPQWFGYAHATDRVHDVQTECSSSVSRVSALAVRHRCWPCVYQAAPVDSSSHRAADSRALPSALLSGGGGGEGGPQAHASSSLAAAVPFRTLCSVRPI